MRADRLREALPGLVRECLAGGAAVRFRVHRESMRPLLRPGDRVVVEGTDTVRPRIGDLLLFESGPDFVVHRCLLPLRGGRILTKGDFRFHPDPPRRCGDLLGRVRSVERGDRVLQMQDGAWRILNPVLGGFFFLEAVVFRGVEGIRKRIGRGRGDRDADVGADRI